MTATKDLARVPTSTNKVRWCSTISIPSLYVLWMVPKTKKESPLIVHIF